MSKPMTEKLKPCPFCGGEAFNRVRPSSIHIQVHCDGCGARGPGEHTEVSAITAWNTRPQSDLTREGVARVVEPMIDAILAMALKET